MDTAKVETTIPTSVVPQGKIPEPSNDKTILEPGCGSSSDAKAVDMSIWGIFLAGVIGGLFALLTPCVFPMIPLTVSFFTKRA